MKLWVVNEVSHVVKAITRKVGRVIDDELKSPSPKYMRAKVGVCASGNSKKC